MICIKCKKKFIKIPNEKEYKTCKRCREWNNLAKKRCLERKKYRSFYNANDLDRTLEEINEYNKTHGTAYSYGQYIAFKDNGFLKQTYEKVIVWFIIILEIFLRRFYANNKIKRRLYEFN